MEKLIQLDGNTVAILHYGYQFSLTEGQLTELVKENENATAIAFGYVWQIKFYHLEPHKSGFVLNDTATARLMAAIVEIKQQTEERPVMDFWA